MTGATGNLSWTKWELVAVTGAKQWYALDITIERNAREAVEYALMEAGSLGTQFDESTEPPQVLAYFDSPPNRERVRDEVLNALRIYGLPSSSVSEMRLREVPNRDWLGEWKKSWQPIPVAKRFLVAPPWSDIPEGNERIVIRIEPGMAFGTGTHETTRLCLTAVEKYFQGGSFLDVGTGTGVLAIAAAKLFPDAEIYAYDVDPEAIGIAEENARLNGVAAEINFYRASIDETTASADLVCANLTVSAILDLLPRLVAATCGRLVLCGILDSQLEIVMEGLGHLGINEVVEISADGEWIAIVV